MLRPFPLLAACAVALLVVSGCDPDQPDPNYSSVTPTPSVSNPSPTPTASGSPTDIPASGPNSSPGEVAPTEPVTSLSRTQEGALAYVTYYVRTVDWVYATSRPDLLTKFFSTTCSTCMKGQSFITDLVKTGSIKGGRVTIKRLGVVQNDGRGGAEYAISANLSVTAASVVTSAGATSATFPATPDTTLTEWITWQDGHWAIVEERYV